jgi:hypothetical protein
MQIPSSIHIPLPWQEALGRVGFEVWDGSFRLNGFRFALEGNWGILVDTRSRAPEDCLRDAVDELGLWKWVRKGGQLRRVFEVGWPGWCEGDEALRAVEVLLRWALGVASGAGERTAPQTSLLYPPNWTETVPLRIQRSTIVREGYWVNRLGRLSARIPVLLEIPSDVPAERRQWMEALLLDAQDRWRLVRFGIVQEKQHETAIASVDLTGGPSFTDLISASVEALKAGVAWLAESAEMLADLRVASRMLAESPIKQERSHHHALRTNQNYRAIAHCQ